MSSIGIILDRQATQEILKIFDDGILSELVSINKSFCSDNNDLDVYSIKYFTKDYESRILIVGDDVVLSVEGNTFKIKLLELLLQNLPNFRRISRDALRNNSPEQNQESNLDTLEFNLDTPEFETLKQYSLVLKGTNDKLNIVLDELQKTEIKDFLNRNVSLLSSSKNESIIRIDALFQTFIIAEKLLLTLNIYTDKLPIINLVITADDAAALLRTYKILPFLEDFVLRRIMFLPSSGEKAVHVIDEEFDSVSQIINILSS